MSDAKKPTHDLYYSRARGDGKDDQNTRIGAAWAQKGDSFSLSIDVPLVLAAGDRLKLFLRKEKTEA